MNTQTTIIKENVTAARRKEIWEMGKTQKFEAPMIYIVKPTEASLSIHGKDPLSKYIDESKIPAGMSVIRIDADKNSGVVYADSGVVLVRIFGALNKVLDARRVFTQIAIQTLTTHGITAQVSTHRPGANDLVVVIDGVEKKFSGCYTDLKQSYFSFFITLDFNAKAVEDLYLLNTDKFSSRGNVTSISDVVTGLRTVSPGIDETIVDKIVAALVAQLGWS